VRSAATGGLAVILALHALACEEKPPPSSPSAAPVVPTLLEQALALSSRARTLLEARKFQEAEPVAREAARLFWQARGPLHTDTRRAAILLATIRVWLHDEQGAGQALQALLQGSAPADASTSFVVRDLQGLTSAAEALQPRGAEAMLRQVLGLQKHWLGPSHPEVARTEVALGGVLLGLCRAAEAEVLLRDALASVESVSGPTSLAVVGPLRKLADSRWQVSDDAGAEQLLARAIAVLEPLEETEAPRLRRRAPCAGAQGARAP
jgi:hypothetical protein